MTPERRRIYVPAWRRAIYASGQNVVTSVMPSFRPARLEFNVGNANEHFLTFLPPRDHHKLDSFTSFRSWAPMCQ
jgi:hypothetical protein